MVNSAGAGFDEYIFPGWSTIAGWIIFIGCIIPIPLVYITNYFREYFTLRRREIGKSVDLRNDSYVSNEHNYLEKPRYIEAITRNNSPRYDWGPKKKINHYGLYSHLNTTSSHNENRQSQTNMFYNESYERDNLSNKHMGNILKERF
ncbi:unnamed protein product [Adineta steineri]|uniref:Uncharacterized protein n=1 Tax=Adineta steineri TaxID=433720 RepID=A0A819CRN7_9BILA|nr:unnamed protein product [Adineta steineri]